MVKFARGSRFIGKAPHGLPAAVTASSGGSTRRKRSCLTVYMTVLLILLAVTLYYNNNNTWDVSSWSNTIDFQQFASHIASQTGGSVMKDRTSHEHDSLLQYLKSIKAPASDYTSYQPAKVEQYLYEHRVELGYGNNPASGCQIWKNASATAPPIYDDLQRLLQELDVYQALVKEYTPVVKDVRRRILQDANYSVCRALELHDDGPLGIFQSQQLSKSRVGWIEPILPPGRHPRWCLPPDTTKRNNPPYLLNLGYLVHDFATLCRTLRPTSRTVLVDLGASLEFGYHKDVTPAIYLTETYAKFGIPFDHIYAYEITPIEPKNVFQKVPDTLLSAYHWINVGVETAATSKLNPWRLVRENFEPDDFVVVKLDVDNTGIELELIRQLLADDALLARVDQFYFEHHISLTEFWPYAETVQKSLELFRQLREKGIPAHYWV